MAKPVMKRQMAEILNRTPQEKYHWLMTLKNGMDCVLRDSDKASAYRRLEKEFKSIADDSSIEPFDGLDGCLELSKECAKLAQDIEDGLIDEEFEEDSRTVSISAREKNEEKTKGGMLRWVLLSFLAIAVIFVICYKNTPTRYIIAGVERAIGLQDGAIKSYRITSGYKDSDEISLAIQKEVLKGTDIGEEVSYGKDTYIVLDKSDDDILLTAKDSMTDKRYHKTLSDVTWADSTLRTWLNTSYLKKRFYPIDITAIKDTQIITGNNPTYHTPGGVTTTDKVFIMDENEAKKYQDILGSRIHNMRLRTPGGSPVSTAFVSESGDVIDYGFPVNEKGCKIRPTFRVDIR